MISKVLTGHSFSGSIRYIMQDHKHTEVLKVEGVRGHDKTLMIEDFNRQQQLRPGKKQACLHTVISFYPGEKPSNQTVVEIAEKYLAGLNIKDTQVAIFKHSDKDHEHIHIIGNMVNNKGQTISDTWIGLRGKKQAQKLTKEYKLIPACSKNMKLTHRESLRTPEQHEYTVYESVKHNLKNCTSLEELEKRLNKDGISVQYKYKGQTKEKQGISFRYGKYSFKGSKIDRSFSLKNLEKTLSLNQHITEQTKQQFKVRPVKNSPLVHHQVSQKEFIDKLTKHKELNMIGNVQYLIKPEPVYGDGPRELSKRKRKRKRLSI